MAQKLEGLYRHASTHAAGVVIGDRPLEQLVPLYRDPRSDMPVAQFNMKWVEAAGLVKFDFLGLKTLTVIDTAVAHIKKRGIDVKIEEIPIDDPATYKLLAAGETLVCSSWKVRVCAGQLQVCGLTALRTLLLW